MVVRICNEPYVTCFGEDLVEIVPVLSVYVDQLPVTHDLLCLFFLHCEFFPAEALKHLQQRCIYF